MRDLFLGHSVLRPLRGSHDVETHFVIFWPDWPVNHPFIKRINLVKVVNNFSVIY